MSGFEGGFGTVPAVPGDSGGKAPMGAFQLPPDPGWEPMEFGDFLEKNGYYKFKIASEKPVPEGVWLSLECQDDDVAGKRIQTRLDDLAEKPKLVFKWRGLILSITGSKEVARGQFNYQPGIFTGRFCYGKTQTFAGKNGPATGVETWITQADYDAAVSGGKHRWAAEVKAAPSIGGFGAPAAPGGGFGLPAGFPVPMPPATAPIDTAGNIRNIGIGGPTAASIQTAQQAPAAAQQFGTTFAGGATDKIGGPIAPIAPPPPPPGSPFAFPGLR